MYVFNKYLISAVASNTSREQRFFVDTHKSTANRRYKSTKMKACSFLVEDVDTRQSKKNQNVRCIFRQFIFTGYSWKRPKEEKAITSKDKGYGIMVATF